MGIMAGNAAESRHAVVTSLDPFQVLLAMTVCILLIRPERTQCGIRLWIEILHHGLRLIEFVHDRVGEFIEVILHSTSNVAATTVLRVLVDDRLHFFRVLGMVSGGTVTGLAADVELHKGSFLVICAGGVTVTALIVSVESFYIPVPVLTNGVML